MESGRHATAPRKVGGGRSERHERRYDARGSLRTNAPEWSDAAARTVLAALAAEAPTGGKEGTGVFARELLQSEARVDAFVRRLKLSVGDRDVAATVIKEHMRRVQACSDQETRTKKVRAFLKPLRERAAAI